MIFFSKKKESLLSSIDLVKFALLLVNFSGDDATGVTFMEMTEWEAQNLEVKANVFLHVQ